MPYKLNSVFILVSGQLLSTNVGRFGHGCFGLGRFGQSFFEGRTFWPEFDFITWIRILP